MPRWLWFVPLGLLVLFGAIQAFRIGWATATLSESDVVQAYVARYAEEVGIAPSDAPCVAVPGPGQGQGIWLVIRCGAAAAVWEYRVDRLGRLQGVTRPGDPETGGRPRT